MQNARGLIAVRIATDVTTWRSERNLLAPAGVACELTGWSDRTYRDALGVGCGIPDALLARVASRGDDDDTLLRCIRTCTTDNSIWERATKAHVNYICALVSCPADGIGDVGTGPGP